MLSLNSDISELVGVGKELALKFRRLNIVTVTDLINHLPFRYDDFSQVNTIKHIKTGPQTLKVKIQTINSRYARTRGTHITEAIVTDGTGVLKCTWFNQTWRAKTLKSGYSYYFSGDFGMHYGSPILLNPSVELVSDFPANTARILPIYKQTKGINSKLIRKLQAQIRHLYAIIKDDLPSEIIELNKFYKMPEAIEKLHWPENQKEIFNSTNRLAFNELFILMMASLINKEENSKLSAPKLKFNKKLTVKMLSLLPFQLTDDQKKASWQIIKDLQLTEPMNRLVQGDVGSGKTVVSLISALQCLNSGYQCALIAPTEILANQHFKFFKQILSLLKFNCHILTSSIKKNERELINLELTNKPICLIGTHAVLQNSVKFTKLGLIIIDEQHRFGVKQRQALQARQNNKLVPHLLSLSATPIPRSIMLTVYGELNVSLIQEMPKGRKTVETEIVLPSGKKHLYAKIDKQIDEGAQVFVVCPKIEPDNDSEDELTSELKSVESEYQKLSKTIFKHRRINFIHGKMKSYEKDDIMAKFKAREYDILISTTVIEVGVDIPGATIMLIEGAERFGLSQLHQLRGRIGRNNQQAYCYVVPSNDGFIPTRLKYFASVSNGFKLAEYDLKLRGPGQMFGLMQSGNLNLKFADPANTELINQVKKSINLIRKNEININSDMLKKINEIRKVSILN